MKTTPYNSRPDARSGFTMLEVIVAIVIMLIAMSIIFESFSAAIRGWKRGTEVLDGVTHGEFAMNHLTAVLNSTIYFNNPRKSYAFTFEKSTTAGLPSDTISFVTASSAMMPENSPLKNGPHRIKLYIDIDDDGNPALFSMAVPAMANFEDFEAEYAIEPHLVSRTIQGLEIMLYNAETEDWTSEWEEDNSVPERVMIMVYVPSDNEDEEPIVFTRVLEIPVAESVLLHLSGPSKTSASGGNSPRRGSNPAFNGNGNPPTRSNHPAFNGNGSPPGQ